MPKQFAVCNSFFTQIAPAGGLVTHSMWQCKLCSITNIRSAHLYQHLHHNHKDSEEVTQALKTIERTQGKVVEQPKFRCPMCAEQFVNAKSFYKHRALFYTGKGPGGNYGCPNYQTFYANGVWTGLSERKLKREKGEQPEQRLGIQWMIGKFAEDSQKGAVYTKVRPGFAALDSVAYIGKAARVEERATAHRRNHFISLTEENDHDDSTRILCVVRDVPMQLAEHIEYFLISSFSLDSLLNRNIPKPKYDDSEDGEERQWTFLGLNDREMRLECCELLLDALDRNEELPMTLALPSQVFRQRRSTDASATPTTSKQTVRRSLTTQNTGASPDKKKQRASLSNLQQASSSAVLSDFSSSLPALTPTTATAFSFSALRCNSASSASTSSIGAFFQFACPHCEFGFNDQDDYDQHMAFHSAEDPFTCGHCSQRFLSAKDFKGHTFRCKANDPIQID